MGQSYRVHLSLGENVTQTLERPALDVANAPLYIPDVEDFIPSADDYIRFRSKYPRLRGGQSSQPVAPAIPFIASAHEHAESAPVITQALSATSAFTTYEFNVPSYGYIRALWLDVNATGGTGTAAIYAADAPFTALEQLTFLDTNGAPIFGPCTGYNTFLSNLYGGYVYQQDIRQNPNYNGGATSGNFRYQVRIPIEISHHDATGCIGNQNASAPYRIRLSINPAASIYTTPPTGYPTLTVTPVLEAWSLPNAVDALGRPQAQLPPNYGTVQYWSERNVTGILSGNNYVQVLRVGNLIRNLIFICRETSASGPRSDNVSPEYPIVNWDARQLFNETRIYRQNRTYEVLESIPTNGRPAGVYGYTFDRTIQDRAGDDKPWLWLPTVEATRLEWTGTFTTGGVVQILVNDIAPAEVNPTQRYALPSATGFHPSGEVPNPNMP